MKLQGWSFPECVCHDCMTFIQSQTHGLARPVEDTALACNLWARGSVRNTAPSHGSWGCMTSTFYYKNSGAGGDACRSPWHQDAVKLLWERLEEPWYLQSPTVQARMTLQNQGLYWTKFTELKDSCGWVRVNYLSKYSPITSHEFCKWKQLCSLKNCQVNGMFHSTSIVKAHTTCRVLCQTLAEGVQDSVLASSPWHGFGEQDGETICSGSLQIPPDIMLEDYWHEAIRLLPASRGGPCPQPTVTHWTPLSAPPSLPLSFFPSLFNQGTFVGHPLYFRATSVFQACWALNTEFEYQCSRMPVLFHPILSVHNHTL